MKTHPCDVLTMTAEQAQANALHLERMRQSCADMADLIEHAKAGEFRENET